MNFDIAINQHLNWVNLVESLFNENDSKILNPSLIIRDDECELGKWLYSVDKDLSANKTYLELVQVHKDFHFQAGSIISCYQSGKIDEARKLHKPFRDLSEHIVSLMNQLKMELKDPYNI